MKLLIVESPAKAKTISKYVGKDFIVKASVGHIRDLPKNNKKAIDIAAGFVPHYEISPGKEKVVSELKAQAKKADEVLLATDPDREGEAIAWHIKEAVGLKNPKRVVFHEITPEAVKEAISHPRDINEHLKKAQEARRVLDRLFGYDLSGLIWKKVRYGLSAGRVQSPALRIIMEREREIRAFLPETYWTIAAEVKTKKGETFALSCSEEPRQEEEMRRILDGGTKGPWKVKSVAETVVQRSPRAPFITSTLQQAASSLLGFSPSKTMKVAQQLYEAGHITYMRTDSTTLSKTALQQIHGVIEKKYGKEYLEPRTFANKSKNAQEAHEAIRPTNATRGAGDMKLRGDQQNLYRLIWQRAVSSQMANARLLRTKIIAEVASGAIPDFEATGSRIEFSGWLVASPESEGKEARLPAAAEKETLLLINIDAQEKQTEPPSRYTEAGLVKELEKRGIGRPSTYAPIMRTIQERGYVEKQGKTLFPTDTGDVVSTFLEEHFKEYISDSFTSEMEDELDDIAEGKREYEKTLKDFYGPFTRGIKAKEKVEKLTNLGPADETFTCPICGGSMIVKLGRGGKFLSCAKFPECQGALTIKGAVPEAPKETGEACPQCKDGKLIQREGKFGPFIACSNFPKCRHIKESEEAKERAKTGIRCPECKEGEIMERRGRFGLFYSCSNYPSCKFAIKARPTGNICEKCGALMMQGTKTIPERCSNKVCENHNPHKKK